MDNNGDPDWIVDKFNIHAGIGDICELLEALFNIEQKAMEANSKLADLNLQMITEDGNPFYLPNFILFSNLAEHHLDNMQSIAAVYELAGCSS